VPEEYNIEYNGELKESGYIAIEEFVYLYFPDNNRDKPQDASYLVIANTINLYICKKCNKTFPLRIKIFKYIFINTCNKQIAETPAILISLNIIKA